MECAVCYEIMKIEATGLTLKYKGAPLFVCFEDCAKNYACENGLEKSRCIAVRDITKLTFMFFTEPKTYLVFKKSFWKALMTGKSAAQRFMELQKKILQYRYTSFDLS